METSLIYDPKPLYLDNNIDTFFEETYMKENLSHYDLNSRVKDFVKIYNDISFYIHSLYVQRINFSEFKHYLKFLEHISKFSNFTASFHKSYWQINKIMKDRNINTYSDLEKFLGIQNKDINTNIDHIYLCFNTSMFSSDKIQSNYNFLQEQIELLEVPLKNDKDINNKLKNIYDDCKNIAHFSKLQSDLEALEGYLRKRFDMPFLYVQVLEIIDLFGGNNFKDISELLDLLGLNSVKNDYFSNVPSYYLSEYKIQNANLVFQREYNSLTKAINYNLSNKENFGELKTYLENLDSIIKGVILNDKLVIALKFFINEILLGKYNTYTLLTEFLFRIDFEYNKENLEFFEIKEQYIGFVEPKNLIGLSQDIGLSKFDQKVNNYTGTILKFKIPKNRRQIEINNYYSSIPKEKLKIINSKYNNIVSQIKKIESLKFYELNLEKEIYNLTTQSKLHTYEDFMNMLDYYHKVNLKYLIRSILHAKYSSYITKVFIEKYGLIVKTTKFSSFLQNVDISSLKKIEKTLSISNTYEEFYSLLSVIE